MLKVSVIPNGYEYFNESCKKGLDRLVVDNAIRKEKMEVLYDQKKSN